MEMHRKVYGNAQGGFCAWAGGGDFVKAVGIMRRVPHAAPKSMYNFKHDAGWTDLPDPQTTISGARA